MFSPGETIVHQFRMPFSNGGISKVVVSYYQNDRLILVKNVYQSEIDNNEKGSQFNVSLSQEESLLFDDNSGFYAQLNAMFTSGTRATSREIYGTNIRQQIRERIERS